MWYTEVQFIDNGSCFFATYPHLIPKLPLAWELLLKRITPPEKTCGFKKGHLALSIMRGSACWQELTWEKTPCQCSSVWWMLILQKQLFSYCLYLLTAFLHLMKLRLYSHPRMFPTERLHWNMYHSQLSLWDNACDISVLWIQCTFKKLTTV